MNSPAPQREAPDRHLRPLELLRACVHRFLAYRVGQRQGGGFVREDSVFVEAAELHRPTGEAGRQAIPDEDGAASKKYHGFSIALHWLLAIALAAVFALGLYMADLPFSPQRLILYNWHKWAGVTILLLSVVRLAWRLTHRPPAHPQTVVHAMTGWQMRAYHATHALMYALFFVVPLVGWAYSSAVGFSIVLFGIVPLPDFVPVSKPLAELIKPWHKISAFGLAGLVLLHVAAALKHHWIDRDGLLERMLPGRK